MFLGRTVREGGLSTIELLVAIAVIAILAGLGFVQYSRVNARVSLEASASDIRQAILRARSDALASGNSHRLVVVSGSRLILESRSSSDWELAREINLPNGIVLTSPGADSMIEFDSRGFANFTPSDLIFVISDANASHAFAPAMSGNTRFQ